VQRLIFLLSASSLTATVCASDSIPADTCIIEVEAPAGARVSLKGKDYGEKRRFTYDSLKLGELYVVPMTITVPGRPLLEKELIIRGGWHVPVVYGIEEHTQKMQQTGYSILLQSGQAKRHRRQLPRATRQSPVKAGAETELTRE